MRRKAKIVVFDRIGKLCWNFWSVGGYRQYVDDVKSGQEHSLRSIFGICRMIDTMVSRKILGRKEEEKK